MALIGNVIWFVFAGWGLGLAWLLAAALASVSIVLLPIAPACLRLASFSAAPFGREVIDKSILDGRESDAKNKAARAGLNLVWLFIVGWWLSAVHVLWGLALCVTIIGFPFGIQAFKIAGAAWWPVGKDVVSKEEAQYAKASAAQARVDARRSNVERA